jgi:FkbM family methyltransferase
MIKDKISFILINYLQFRSKTVGGKKYRIKNPLVIFKKKGTIKLTNGNEFIFNKDNKKDVLKVVFFALNNGIEFGNGKYQWKFDPKNEIIETHQGIRFKMQTIDIRSNILDETFLYQIHFSGFDLKGKTVITAGAYIGDTPLFYSYYGAKVYAFEPDPNSFKKAEENILLNPALKDNIILRNYAIGEDGEIDFPVEEDSVASSIYRVNVKNKTKVKSVSIKTILNEFNISEPYLLDLDIKGAEFSVIEDTSISKFQKIRIEYSPYLLNQNDKSLEFLIQKLKYYGFTKFRIYKHNNLRFDLTYHGTLEAEKEGLK